MEERLLYDLPMDELEADRPWPIRSTEGPLGPRSTFSNFQQLDSVIPQFYRQVLTETPVTILVFRVPGYRETQSYNYTPEWTRFERVIVKVLVGSYDGTVDASFISDELEPYLTWVWDGIQISRTPLTVAMSSVEGLQREGVVVVVTVAEHTLEPRYLVPISIKIGDELYPLKTDNTGPETQSYLAGVVVGQVRAENVLSINSAFVSQDLYRFYYRGLPKVNSQ